MTVEIPLAWLAQERERVLHLPRITAVDQWDALTDTGYSKKGLLHADLDGRALTVKAGHLAVSVYPLIRVDELYVFRVGPTGHAFILSSVADVGPFLKTRWSRYAGSWSTTPIHIKLTHVADINRRFPHTIGCYFPSGDHLTTAEHRLLTGVRCICNRALTRSAVLWTENQRFVKIICSAANEYHHRCRKLPD